MSRRSKSVILITAVALLLFPTTAYAALYWVMAYDNSTVGKTATGTYGYNYVMSDPVITSM
ncbi:MAG: hypothetical protein AB1330_12690 [Bacillota bacterium]